MLKEAQKEIIRTQLMRVINVRSNLLRHFGRNSISLVERAYMFIHSYDNPVRCNSTEEMIFSAMQEGRS